MVPVASRVAPSPVPADVPAEVPAAVAMGVTIPMSVATAMAAPDQDQAVIGRGGRLNRECLGRSRHREGRQGGENGR